MHCMVASSIPCKLSLCADRAHACAGDSYVSSGIDVSCPTTQSVLAIASPHELHGDSWPSSSTGTRSFCCNQQYSITAITTSTGAISERYAYTAYGQPTILDASASVLSSSAINNRYTYTGREWDATIALHHFRARWMSPNAGRFLSRDPIRYRSGLNMYQYARSSPFVFIDPSGLLEQGPGGGAGAIGNGQLDYAFYRCWATCGWNNPGTSFVAACEKTGGFITFSSEPSSKQSLVSRICGSVLAQVSRQADDIVR
jgi:RHS repeat-associated protein